MPTWYVTNIRGFVVERLRHGDAVLIVDETGDLKKGADTVGVQPLGPGGHRRRSARTPPTARPSQPARRRTRLLPLLLSDPGAVVQPGADRRTQLDSRGDRPVRRGPGRTGRSPKSDAGHHGTAGSPWLCSPTPSSCCPPRPRSRPLFGAACRYRRAAALVSVWLVGRVRRSLLVREWSGRNPFERQNVALRN